MTADSATLNLLEPLLSDGEIDALMLIGAYRDGEVGPSHPLTRVLTQLDAAGVAVHRVPLAPLPLPDLASLVRDALHCDLESAEPLAGLVARKTGGNPFFVGQFLKALRDAELLRFDYERRRAAQVVGRGEAGKPRSDDQNVLTPARHQRSLLHTRAAAARTAADGTIAIQNAIIAFDVSMTP